ncbi:hypothetical protein C0991_000862 [Blastosporella zonata]|nr:hypothetical protein C0991_000862 [Blastosporella zonata]
MASTTANASVPAYMLPGVPVFQPTHLEGDSSLATEILPGPPSLVSTQQSMLKKDPKKPPTAFSYLPPADPGSTYSGIMHGTLIGHEQDATRLKRTKSAIGRAQRASARNQNGTVQGTELPADSELASASSLNPIPVDSEPDTMAIDDEPSISRSNSSQNLLEATVSAIGRPKRKDKGKGKEVELAAVRVKEEPKAVSLHTPDPPHSNLLNNDDHCSSCRSYGALVYCDGCPRAFHLWCLDPPMESVDEGDSRWFCPGCTIRKHPPRKPPPSLLAPLIQQVDTTIPTEFQLPEDVRTFFKDVGTGPKGSYVDTSEIKPPRLNRHGQLEERDVYRLRDRNGSPVLCFCCGTSALPGGLAAAAPATKRARRSSALSKTSEAWKSIISCDYCSLHWHLDCLDPPLSTIPPFSKKWRCPNHAENILPLKHRIPKQNATPIEITKSRQYNNGNIEISHPIAVRPVNAAPKVTVDEVLINGRRYRVPERVIVLDFWNKLNKSEPQIDRDSNIASGMSSPLTSLSSLDDEDQAIPDIPMTHHDPEELRVAQMLCSFSFSQPRAGPSSSQPISSPPTTSLQPAIPSQLAIPSQPPLASQPSVNGASSNGPQSEMVVPARSSRVIRLPKVAASKLPDASPKVLKTNGSSRALPKAQRNSSAAGDYQPSSTAKRKKLNQPVVPAPELSTRELRSRSKNNFDSSLTSISSRGDDSGRDSMTLDGPLSAAPRPPATAPGRPRQLQVKLEEVDPSLTFASASAGPSTGTPAKRRGRAPKAAATSNLETKEVKEKRGRKRKEREDELPNIEDKDLVDEKPEKKERKPRKKVVRTPARRAPVSPVVSAALDPGPSTVPPTTPSLKIRLPRLNSGIHASPSIPNTNGDTPTRL